MPEWQSSWNYPAPPLEPPPEELPLMECAGCGVEIFRGYEYYEIDRVILCPDCVEKCKKTAGGDSEWE